MNRSQLLRRASSPRLLPGTDQGFTLIELLVGAALTVTVVSALAAIALIAELRMGREAEVNQALRDNWSRALTFLRNEAHHAYWIRTSLRDGVAYPCAGGTPSTPLVFEGPPSEANPKTPQWQVVYGVRANPDGDPDWRGFNRLVRCGPSFEALDRNDPTAKPTVRARRDAAKQGNLNLASAYTETVVVDQLASVNPLQVMIFDDTKGYDRDAQLNLFLSRRTGNTYPPAGSVPSTYHMQLRAARNPGFEVGPNSVCETKTDPATGNQEPPAAVAGCQVMGPKIESERDSRARYRVTKSYHLPESGSMTVNGCGPSCNGARSTSTTDVIYFTGNYDSFKLQFSASEPGKPCSRTSCYVSNGKQSVQIYDGNSLVFFDRTLRL